jgi:hypothetical protein
MTLLEIAQAKVSLTYKVQALAMLWQDLNENEQACEIQAAINAGEDRNSDLIQIARIMQGK